MPPSPLRCPQPWQGSDVPFDAVPLLHLWVWEAAPSHGLPGLIHPPALPNVAGEILALLSRPVPTRLPRLAVCSFLMRCLGRAASWLDRAGGW